MPDRYQLRHHDYLMNVGTVAAGQTLTGLSLQLDNDAPFVLRGRAIHLQPPAVAGHADQAQLVNYYDRLLGPDNDYRAQELTRFYLENRNLGQFGQFLPVRTPVLYPAGGIIQAEVYNAGVTDMEGVEIYFRGSKLYPSGVLGCATYPPKFSPMPYDYVSSPVPGYPDYVPQLAAVGADSEVRNIVRNIESDADFVVRSLSVGAWGELSCPGPTLSNYYSQLYIQLRDEFSKPYSNLPVHADTCFGINNANWGATCSVDQGSLVYAASGGTVSNLQDSALGTNHPPLLLPEIYVKHNHFLLVDLYRHDGYLSGLYAVGDVAVWLRFGGMKIFNRG